MNCPKADTRCYVSHPHGKPEDSRLMCPDCGWQSDTLEDLVKVSPAYRLASLKASGAAPGWYGPDGAACDIVEDIERSMLGVVWHGYALPVELARLCGFMEVPHG